MTKIEDINYDRIRGQIIYKGECIDSDDPLRLGRIRAKLRTENKQDREIANQNFGVDSYEPWGQKDPFLFKPLLPFFLNTPPKESEYVHLFYSNITRKGDKDKFYIGGVFSSPTTVYEETYNSAVTNLDEGTRNKPFRDIVNLNTSDKTIGNATNGVFAEPKDIAFYGRGTADIVLKENEVILRAGKNKKLKKNKTPLPEKNRAFIQLSKFTETTKKLPTKEILVPVSSDKPTQHIIEYDIETPENSFSAFTGSISFYKLTTEIFAGLLEKNPQYSIPNTEKKLINRIQYSFLSMNDTIELIKDSILMFRENRLHELSNNNTPFIEILNPTKLNSEDMTKMYPVFYRLEPSLYKKLNNLNGSMSNPTGQAYKNIQRLLSSVSQGLIFSKKGETSVPTSIVNEKIENEEILPINKTVGIIGGDELFLLSHKTQNENGKITSLNDTLYGITENMVVNDIIPKTSSVVRGEELLDLLNLIIRFLVSHVHAYPGLSPVTEGTDGVTIEEILKEFQNATNKILNSKIRIN